MDERDGNATGIADLGLRVLHQNLEVSLLLILVADAFGVFSELRCVVGLGEKIFQEDGMGNPNRPQVLHSTAQFAAGQALVALELDLADLDLRAFTDNKSD